MKNMKEDHVEIIGGADGPTSIFLAGKRGRAHQSLRDRIRQYLYRKRRGRIMAGIKSSTHTLDEVLLYARRKYGAKACSTESWKYKEAFSNCREALLEQYRPELLGPSLRDFVPESFEDEEAIQEFLKRCEEYHKRAARIPHSIFPLDFKLYLIHLGKNGTIWIAGELTYEFFGVDYSVGRENRRQAERIVRDLYLYYGVSKKDIREKSQRFQMLVTTLAS